VCALHCAQLLHTILHRTHLIIFPLTLQTITIAPMMSIWGKGGAAATDKVIIITVAMRDPFSDSWVMMCRLCRESCSSRLWRHTVFACSSSGSHWHRCLMCSSLTGSKRILCQVTSSVLSRPVFCHNCLSVYLGVGTWKYNLCCLRKPVIVFVFEILCLQTMFYCFGLLEGC